MEEKIKRLERIIVILVEAFQGVIPGYVWKKLEPLIDEIKKEL